MLQQFLEKFKQHAAENSFLKATLSKVSKHVDTDLKNCYLRPVLIKEEWLIAWTFHYKTRDEAKNLSIQESVDNLEQMLGTVFLEAFLFVENEEISLKHNKKGKATILIKKNKATSLKSSNQSHNREKIRLLDAKEPWLHDLNITNAEGQVLKTAHDKWRQINKFLEIIDSLLKDVPIVENAHIADMGSGKGYLTFALFTFLQKNKDLDKVKVSGIELRQNLVDFCNKTAQKHGLNGLDFIAQDIADFEIEKLDMLIALHACDTATDLAIAQGLQRKAEILVLAPCCHKQIRKAMKPKNEMAPLLQHGILLERQAEMVTDGIRALILEAEGYKTKVFEFISADHTAKNVMITATKRSTMPTGHRVKSLQQVEDLKDAFGIEGHYLEKMVKEVKEVEKVKKAKKVTLL